MFHNGMGTTREWMPSPSSYCAQIIPEEDYTLYHPSGERILDGGHLDHGSPINHIVRLELPAQER